MLFYSFYYTTSQRGRAITAMPRKASAIFALSLTQQPSYVAVRDVSAAHLAL